MARNRKLEPFEVLAMQAKLRQPTSHNDETINFQLMGYYPDDPTSRDMYRALAKKWEAREALARLEREWAQQDRGQGAPSPVLDFHAENVAQVRDALARMEMDFSKIPRFPWTSLHDAVGHGLLPESFTVVPADSGMGKTTFVMSLCQGWLDEGRRIYMLPLEQGVDVTRLYLAALACRLSVKAVIKNDWGSLPKDAFDQIQDHVRWQCGAGSKQLYLHPEGRVPAKKIPALYRQAADFGAELFVIDHIHRVRVKDYSEYEDMCSSVVEGAKEHMLPALASAQNHRGVGPQDRLKAHVLPLVDRVQGGKVLEQECSLMLGVFRPMIADIEDGTMKAIRAGRLPVKDYIKPLTVGVANMKARVEGEVGWVIELTWRGGRIIDAEDEAKRQLEEKYNV